MQPVSARVYGGGAVDLTMAGHGRIAVDIRGELTRPLVEIVERCEGLHTVSFVPQECCLHSIVITMNGIPVPGRSAHLHLHHSIYYTGKVLRGPYAPADSIWARAWPTVLPSVGCI